MHVEGADPAGLVGRLVVGDVAAVHPRGATKVRCGGAEGGAMPAVQVTTAPLTPRCGDAAGWAGIERTAGESGAGDATGKAHRRHFDVLLFVVMGDATGRIMWAAAKPVPGWSSAGFMGEQGLAAACTVTMNRGIQ